MNAFFAANRLSQDEKENILKQHRTIYDGYRTMQSQVSNEQPLYVQDFAKDKVGVVLNNKGIAKPYTNVGINESKKELMCGDCGGAMMEGECMECGWKGEVGAMEEDFDFEDMEDGEDLVPAFSNGEFVGMEKPMGDMEVDTERKNFRPGLDLGKSFDKFKDMKENTGKLSDIYNVEDLGNDEFDYVEGGGNKYGTFEKMHHMKKIKSEQVDNTNDFQTTDDFIDGFDDTDNEDDGFEDLQMGSSEMYEQGMFGGGHAPDTSLSLIEPGYNFKSDGPEMGDEPYDIEADDMDLDKEEEKEPFDFESGGPMAGGDVYPQFESMESAWSDDLIDEANDISGVQGIYGDMKPAYDFDSEGPGSAGPYQTSSWGGGATSSDEIERGEAETTEQFLPKHLWNKMKRREDAEKKGEDFDKSELVVSDYEDDFDPESSSWEEITALTGDDEFSHLDEDIKESFVRQQQKIMEMFNRMKVIK